MDRQGGPETLEIVQLSQDEWRHLNFHATMALNKAKQDRECPVWNVYGICSFTASNTTRSKFCPETIHPSFTNGHTSTVIFLLLPTFTASLKTTEKLVLSICI